MWWTVALWKWGVPGFLFSEFPEFLVSFSWRLWASYIKIQHSFCSCSLVVLLKSSFNKSSNSDNLVQINKRSRSFRALEVELSHSFFLESSLCHSAILGIGYQNCQIPFLQSAVRSYELLQEAIQNMKL